MTPYRGILLDFYGTLVHEDDDVVSAICDEIFHSAAVQTSPNEIAQFWYDAVFPLVARSFGSTFLSQREAATQALVETVHHFGSSLDPARLVARQFTNWVAPTLYPDSRPFLDFLNRQQRPVCLVSNIDRHDLEQALALHDLRFDHLVTSDDVSAYKPRPEMFERALDMLGFAPAEVLHIGDSRTSDIAGAQNVGIAVAWVNRTGKVWSAGPLPDFTVTALGELQTLLETL